MKFKRNSQYFYWGLTFLCVIFFGIILWVSFNNLTGFFAVLQKLLNILSPVLYGLVFAYLLNPIMMFVERYILKWLRGRKLSEKAVRSLSRGSSVVAAVLVGLLLVYAFFAMLLPSLIDSVSGIVSNMQNYYTTAQKWIANLAAEYPEYSDLINTFYDKAYQGLTSWFQLRVLDNMDNLVVGVTTQVYSVVKGVTNLLIGAVAAIYMLLSKEKFLAQTKKIVVAVMKRSRADRLFDVCQKSNRVFSGFISGKILDSLIIGVLCYIGMSILRLPYAVLISTIVGVTNIIPFFGPFIGAIPSALLIVLVNPLQALYFLIFVFVLQQVDGNLIGPHILGDAVGLPSFWILVSITFFGGMFGFIGMLLGVPVFAVIYMIVRENVERKLKDKGAPAGTAYYYHMSRTGDLDSMTEEEEPATESKISEDEKREAEEAFWK
ncbi:MAG: AI-2E family transporter [Oscillospiraceae bacterium]|nr:AI-2E family transporter [Oscillospiraceae bacterium]